MNNNPHLLFVPMDEVKYHWAKARNFILSAAEAAGETTEEKILADLGACNLHLFVVYKDDKLIGAATTAIVKYPHKTVAIIVHLGGPFHQYLQAYLSDIEAWALAHGATALRIRGRKGWRKVLAPMNFREKFVTLEKDLERRT